MRFNLWPEVGHGDPAGREDGGGAELWCSGCAPSAVCHWGSRTAGKQTCIILRQSILKEKGNCLRGLSNQTRRWTFNHFGKIILKMFNGPLTRVNTSHNPKIR